MARKLSSCRVNSNRFANNIIKQALIVDCLSCLSLLQQLFLVQLTCNKRYIVTSDYTPQISGNEIYD